MYLETEDVRDLIDGRLKYRKCLVAIQMAGFGMMDVQEKVYHHTHLLTYLILRCSARGAIIAKAWVIFYTDRRMKC